MSISDIALIKFTMLLIGIAIGTKWSYVFEPYLLIMTVIALSMGFYSFYSWLKK